MGAISARASDGSNITLGDELVTGLRAALRGQLLSASDGQAYDDARAIWNGMIDRRPALIARCLGVSDVVACVNFAREHGVLLTIKSGGHNIAGVSVADGALTIDNSLMRGVFVDVENRTAVAQSGCILGDIDRETQVHGLAAVQGFVSETGLSGLTLGGGFGYLSRQYGWTSDTVNWMEVVTADGRVVRASESNEPELFWGLRGGGGNFAVVTKIEYKLYEVGPEIMGGAVAWAGDDLPRVLEFYRSALAEAPPEQTLVVAIRPAPPAPWLPPEHHGKLIVAIFVCDSGPMDQAKKRADKIRSFGNPIGDILQPRPYTQQQSILDPTQPSGRRYYWKSEYLPSVEPGLCEKLGVAAQSFQSPHSAMLLFSLEGALNKLPDEHSAVGNRDAKVVVNIASSWEDAAADDANIGWAREAWESVREFSTGGTYINFLVEEDGDARIKEAFRGNYDRLVDIKTKYDPTNLFRTNKNITPR